MSAPGPGARVAISTPFTLGALAGAPRRATPTDAAAVPAAYGDQPEPAAVLLVDDNPANLVAFAAVLAPVVESSGCQLLRANDADEALRHVLTHGDRIAVVLLDVMMPGTDGLETARLIRQRAASDHVPIIFVTALDADRRRVTLGYQSGAVDYIAKPVDPEVLTAKVRAFVELHQRRNEAAVRERRRFADQMAAAEQAEQAAQSAWAVVESLPDAVGVFDAEWRCTYLNGAARHVVERLGANPDGMVGRVIWDVLPNLVGTPFEAHVRAAAGESREITHQAYFEPFGAWLELRALPGPGGTLNAHLRDVTVRRRAEEELERLVADAQAARAEAEAANRAKSEFLAVMSHELRTPLNAIAGYAELIELGVRGPVTHAQREDLGRIQRSQRHLLGLINGVLNYARVEGGHVHYDVADVALQEVLATCESLVAPQVRAKGLTVDFSACDAAVGARADREKVQQVLLNLLSNSVKFTEPGGALTISCGVEGERAFVRVADTGRGIAPDQLERIFHPFVQVDARLTRTQEGTGLGLSISRDLARGMAGDLTAESEPGAGSVFTLTLPRAGA